MKLMFTEIKSGILLWTFSTKADLKNYFCHSGLLQRKWLSGTFPHPIVWYNNEFETFCKSIGITTPDGLFDKILKQEMILSKEEATYFRLKFLV